MQGKDTRYFTISTLQTTLIYILIFRLVYLVQSYTENDKEREMIRNTWGHENMYPGVKLFFFLGQHKSAFYGFLDKISIEIKKSLKYHLDLKGKTPRYFILNIYICCLKKNIKYYLKKKPIA